MVNDGSKSNKNELLEKTKHGFTQNIFPLLLILYPFLLFFSFSMKFLHTELECGNTTPKQTVSNISKVVCIIFVIFSVTTAVLKMNKFKVAFGDLKEPESLPSTSVKKCEIFSGEWVPNPEAPYYTNTTCWAIHEHQNCMKHGRPDSEFMKWRWKPNECELPIFNPFQFLEIMRGKSLAFVGDSLARNHMQSMICLLSRVSVSPTFSRFRFISFFLVFDSSMSLNFFKHDHSCR